MHFRNEYVASPRDESHGDGETLENKSDRKQELVRKRHEMELQKQTVEHEQIMIQSQLQHLSGIKRNADESWLTIEDLVTAEGRLERIWKSCHPQSSKDKIINNGKTLMALYERSLVHNERQEAAKVASDFLVYVETFVYTTAHGILRLAITLRKAGKILVSILFFATAAGHFKTLRNTEAVEGMARCCDGLYHASIAFVEREKNAEHVLQSTVEIMRNLRREIAQIECAEKETRCLCEANCLRCIALVQHLFDDYDVTIETADLGLKIIADNVASPDTFPVYGHLLNNLGYFHSKNSEFDEAADYFLRAIRAKEKAKGVSDDLRKRWIEKSKLGLKMAYAGKNTAQCCFRSQNE